MFLLINVEDILLICSKVEKLSDILKGISAWFDTRVEQTINNFLGLESKMKVEAVMIHSESAVKRIFHHFKMDFCRPGSVLLPPGIVSDKLVQTKTDEERKLMEGKHAESSLDN